MKKLLKTIIYCFFVKKRRNKKSEIKLQTVLKNNEEMYLETLLEGLLEEERIKRTKLQREKNGKPQLIQIKTDFSKTGVREFSLPLN